MLSIKADQPPVASRLRRLLSVYLDFLLFSGVFHPIAWVLESAGLPRAPFLARIAVFIVLRILAGRVLRATPGEWALGVLPSIPWSFVDPEVKRREAWWTMLLGIVLVLEGSKNLVRWTQGLPPPPIFGSGLLDAVSFAAISLVGAANIVAGLLLLRTRPAGALLGAGVLLMELIAAMANRTAFRVWAAQSVTVRRSLQGRPLREGELEFVQGFISNGLTLGLLVGLVLLLLAYRRFSNHRTT